MICPSCGKGTLSPKILSRPYMIIKDRVTNPEMETDTVFVQSTTNKWGYPEHTASYYLNKELAMVGLQLSTMSLSCLYLHIPPKSRKTKDDKVLVNGCFGFSLRELIKIANTKKAILLMGAETIRTFIGLPSTEIYGLANNSELLPDVPVIIPAPNPDNIMRQPIGELRFALREFANQIKVYEEYSKI